MPRHPPCALSCLSFLNKLALGSPVTLPSVAGLLSFFFLDVLIFLDVHYSIVKVRDAVASAADRG